jgi:hypothetical protein
MCCRGKNRQLANFQTCVKLLNADYRGKTSSNRLTSSCVIKTNAGQPNPSVLSNISKMKLMLVVLCAFLSFADAQFGFGGFGGRINAQLPGLGGLNVNNVQIPGLGGINAQIPRLDGVEDLARTAINTALSCMVQVNPIEEEILFDFLFQSFHCRFKS